MSTIKRYELKYSYGEKEIDSVYSQILLHPMLFREIFEERDIYNIYLDTDSLSNYYDNVNGSKYRIKRRIRWYNDSKNAMCPILEYKCKEDKLGWKEHFMLPDFVLDESFDWADYMSEIQRKYFGQETYTKVFEDLKWEKPVLHNYYSRRYFISADKKFRITVDKDLYYNKIEDKYFKTLPKQDNRIIVEVKFDECDYQHAPKLTNYINSRLYKNSKYVTGVNVVRFNETIPWEV